MLRAVALVLAIGLGPLAIAEDPAVSSEIDELRAQVAALRKAVEQLNAALAKQSTAPPPAAKEIAGPLPCIALADSTSGSELVVTRGKDASDELIRRKAESLLSKLRKDWAGANVESPHQRIQIDAAISEDEAQGWSTYYPGADGRPRSVNVEVTGNINGVVKDALPRQLSQVVLAERIGVPPRWAGMGVGLLAESRQSQNKNWRTFRGIRDSGNLIPAAELLAYTQYPTQSEKLKIMYVQSMAIAEFIVSTWDRETFVAFVADAKRSGAPLAVRNHLAFDTVGDFDLAFRQWAADR